MRIRDVSWEQYSDIVKQLSLEIISSYQTYDYIFGIPRGGLPCSVMLSHLLEIPIILHLDYNIIANKSVLVVDDIIDSGETITKFRDVFDTAAVMVKVSIPEERRPTYWTWDGLVEVDEWIKFPYETSTNDSISKVTMDS